MLRDVIGYLKEHPDGRYRIRKSKINKFLWWNLQASWEAGIVRVDRDGNLLILNFIDLESYDSLCKTYMRYYLVWDLVDEKVVRRAYTSASYQRISETDSNKAMEFDHKIRKLIIGSTLNSMELFGGKDV